TQMDDLRIVGGTLHAAVPGPVVRLPVPVVLAVGLVVLLVVRDQIVEGEAVVRRDEVDRRDRSPTGVLVQVRRTGQPGGELTQGRGFAPPEVPDGVPVLAVPL